MKAGQFARAFVAFSEEDRRGKYRPVLILAKARMANGTVVYLVAPDSTKVDKCHGDFEVVLSLSDAESAGMDQASVLRFSRQSLRAVREQDISHTYGRICDLPQAKQIAIRHAAKAVGCEL